MRRFLAVLVLLPCLAFADAVSVSLQNKMRAGDGYPNISVEIEEPIAGFWLKLKRSDGKAVSVKGGGKPGVVRTIDLSQPEGKFSYTGELLVNLPNGTSASMPLEFETELWGSLHMKLDKKDVDVEHRSLKLSVDRPIAKVHLKVLMDTGRPAFDDDVAFHEEAAGTALTLTWPEASGRVIKIAVTPYDSLGFFTGVELFPWQIDIPHEEVNFDSAKWDVKPDEEKKLEKSYKQIDDAVAKYGSLADIKLYVAGHTDTVGAKDYNRGLSVNRAKSLCAWFWHRGVRIPIFYAGFGEDALLVGTNDETDEPRNRRAEYIIAIDQPTVAHQPYPADWKKL